FTLVLLALLLLMAAAVLALNLRGEDPLPANAQPRDGTAEQIQRGAYLAQVGNCAGCHTARGGEPYAGGLKLLTPFGAITASNLTPDNETGLGRWSPEHFWRALHNGRSRDGRLLYPAFPYPNYTRVNRADADALYAYLRSVKPVNLPVPAHELEFPYNTQAALGVWRALYFSPSAPVSDAEQSADWNRGANLVQGLGHCNACHSSRNLLGASASAFDLNGGLIPMQNWYAPSLTAPDQAGVSHWTLNDITTLLKTGMTANASVQGPMAEVVVRSTQHWSDADLRAAAVYLKALPASPPLKRVAARPDPAANAKGPALYQQHCAQCHGDRGEGVAGVYPALAGNRAVVMDPPANLVRVVLEGGYAPATRANPRPYGMPPFEPVLDANELAAVLTHVRSNWGNEGTLVTSREVERYRSGVN
ncbi:MAG: hypothetical protein RLZZ618_1532, partial [Pseudomonadota bacterium]